MEHSPLALLVVVVVARIHVVASPVAASVATSVVAAVVVVSPKEASVVRVLKSIAHTS